MLDDLLPLDHVVFAGPDLAAAVAEFERLSGVRPVRGGQHQGLGTANYLVGLGDGGYLEIIGPDPEQPEPARPRPFGIDTLTTTQVVSWAVRVEDIDARVAAARAAGYDPGVVRSMSRRTADGTLLNWRLTANDGPLPFLIDWGSTRHPTSAELPSAGLDSLVCLARDPEPVRRAVQALGVDLPVHPSNRDGLVATLVSARGQVMLS